MRWFPTARSAAKSWTSWRRNGTWTTGGVASLGEPGEVLLLARRDLLEVGQVGVRAAEVGAGERAGRARAAASGGPSPKRGCMRFTTRARTAMPPSASRSAKYVGLLDRVAPRRRPRARTRSPASASSSSTLPARSRKPAPCLRTPGRTRSRRRPPRRRRPSRPCAGTPARRRCTAFTTPRVGRHQDAVEAVVEEAGEPPRRVEEVERVAVGGVSTTTRSKSRLVVQLVELLHRHVLLRAREGAGDVAVEAVGEDALRPARRRAA